VTTWPGVVDCTRTSMVGWTETGPERAAGPLVGQGQAHGAQTTYMLRGRRRERPGRVADPTRTRTDAAIAARGVSWSARCVVTR